MIYRGPGALLVHGFRSSPNFDNYRPISSAANDSEAAEAGAQSSKKLVVLLKSKLREGDADGQRGSIEPQPLRVGASPGA